MAYCVPKDVYDAAGLSSDDISTPVVRAAILTATAKLNADINVTRIEEQVRFIDQYRENKIDGNNTDYYVRDSFNYYLGDYNNDGEIDENDVIVWVYDTTTKTKTQATVDSVDWQKGMVTLSSPPQSNTRVFITYARASLDEYTPHALVKEACKALSVSLAYMRLRAADYQKLDLGDLRVTSSGRGQVNPPITIWANAYEDIVRRINSGELLSEAKQPGLRYLSTTKP
jgi:hypothetical protein